MDNDMFQKQACVVSLHNMLVVKNHFDICALDKIASVLGVKLGGPDYAALRTLHCVDWGQMPDELRTTVRIKCFELLRLPSPEFHEVSNPVKSVFGKSIIKRLSNWVTG